MIFDEKTLSELLRGLEGEAAKSQSELECAERDLKQAQARLKFILAAIHYLKQRI